MSLFVGFMFWYHVFGTVVLLACMATLKYPRTTTKTMGQEVIGLVMMLVVLIWAGLLNFGLIK